MQYIFRDKCVHIITVAVFTVLNNKSSAPMIAVADLQKVVKMQHPVHTEPVFLFPSLADLRKHI